MAKLILVVVVVVAIVLFLLFMFPVLHVSMASPTTTTVSSSSISIPSSKGYVNGKIAFFIATDVSDNQTAASITKNLGYKVNFAPSLALIPESALQQGYEFVNGIKGEGAFGFQIPVASALPGDKGYSPIVQLNFVKWNNNATAKELKSAEQIIAAKSNGELEITKTNIFINSPPLS
jgi:hypothetical protein